jgi:N utilization substance protein B
MSSPRRLSRQLAFQVLYALETRTQLGVLPTDLAGALTQHFEHFKAEQGLREYAARLVAGAANNAVTLDEKISGQLKDWKFERLSSMDRAFLRLGVYELLYCTDVPAASVIDEWVDVAKLFGTAESSAFVNAVLDKLKRQ